MISNETCVDTRHRQVAQTVSHVMLDHMSSSGVMHGDGRRRGEEMVKHERKKENIAAVLARYHNRHVQQRRRHAWPQTTRMAAATRTARAAIHMHAWSAAATCMAAGDSGDSTHSVGVG